MKKSIEFCDYADARIAGNRLIVVVQIQKKKRVT